MKDIGKQHDITVVAVGDKTELSFPVQFIEAPCVSQQEDLQLAEDTYPADVHVLLQLTQPIRERGLLLRTIEQFKENGRTIISGTLMPNMCWRAVDENGVWSPKKGGRTVYHDGVIYAWGRGMLHEVYERETPHDLIISSERLPLVDIDYREDIPEDLDILWRCGMHLNSTED